MRRTKNRMKMGGEKGEGGEDQMLRCYSVTGPEKSNTPKCASFAHISIICNIRRRRRRSDMFINRPLISLISLLISASTNRTPSTGRECWLIDRVRDWRRLSRARENHCLFPALFCLSCLPLFPLVPVFSCLFLSFLSGTDCRRS